MEAIQINQACVRFFFFFFCTIKIRKNYFFKTNLNPSKNKNPIQWIQFRKFNEIHHLESRKLHTELKSAVLLISHMTFAENFFCKLSSVINRINFMNISFFFLHFNLDFDWIRPTIFPSKHYGNQQDANRH